MKPSALTDASFDAYPDGGRQLAVGHLGLLRTMPLALLPAYLAQVRQLGALFPVEAERLRSQLAALEARPALMDDFRAIAVPPALEARDWVGHPERFEGALAEALWQTGQIDAYHRAGAALFAALPAPPGPHAPLLLGVMGRGAAAGVPVFARMRADGLHLRKVREEGAAEVLRRLLEERARGGEAYRHWYVDGGSPLWAGLTGVTQFTYPGTAEARAAVVREMDRAVLDGTGPERLAERLRTAPLVEIPGDVRVARFVQPLLTEGSGTQLRGGARPA